MSPTQAGPLPLAAAHVPPPRRRSALGRIAEAGQYWFVTMLVLALALGVGYGIGGFIVFDASVLNSGFVHVGGADQIFGSNGCATLGTWGAASGDTSCDGVNGSPATASFSTRTTFPVYCIALATIIGWLLFMVFAGVGLISLPVDMIKSYMYRPQTMITKTDYIRQGGEIGKKAKEVLDGLRAAQTDVRRNGRTRKSRRAISVLTSDLQNLEAEELKLREVYPQGEDAELSWAVTVIGYFINLAGGVIAAGLTCMWLIHILIYMFITPPLDPLLNTMFIQMDAVFGLFGTAAFAVFCFYLVLATLKGNFKLGLNFLFFSVHPMSPGNTLMSSFLFNTGLIMLCSISIIQFCASAFDEYANETSIDEIFGNQITNLKGIGYIFRKGIFVFALFAISGLTALISPFINRTRAKPKRNFDESYE